MYYTMTQTHSKHTGGQIHTAWCKIQIHNLSADGEVLPRAGQCVFECVLCFQSVQCWQCLGKRTGGVLVLIIASKLPHSLSHTHTNSHRHTHRGSRGLNGATVSVLSLLTKSDNASCDKLLFRGTFQKQIYLLHDHLRRKKNYSFFSLSLSISLFSLSTKQLWMNCTLKQSRESRTH